MGNIFAAIFLTSKGSKRLPGWSVSISKWIREPKCPTSRLGQKQLMAQRWVLASGSPNTCWVALTLPNNEFISACCTACLPELQWKQYCNALCSDFKTKVAFFANWATRLATNKKFKKSNIIFEGSRHPNFMNPFEHGQSFIGKSFLTYRLWRLLKWHCCRPYVKMRAKWRLFSWTMSYWPFFALDPVLNNG